MAEMVVAIEGGIQLDPDASVSLDGPINLAEGQTVGARPYAQEDSLHAAGVVEDPEAGEAICTIIAPPSGFYRIDVHRAAGGTGTPTLFNNGELRVGPRTFTLMALAALEIPYSYTFYATLNGSQNISVNSVLAASPGVTISASITATRMA